MGCLHVNKTKCFIMIFASFKDLHSIHNLCLHGIHNLCLHGRIIHKNCFCLHDTPGERSVVYTISRPIFCILHIIIQDGFSGLSGLKGESQGLYLWYIVKESQNLLLKRQNNKKTALVSTSFQLSASHSFLSVKLLLNRSNCAKRIGKS